MKKLIAILALISLGITACEKEDVFDKPNIKVNASDWYQVPSSGGTVEVEDFTIEFPKGAFSGTGKVAVTPVPNGKVTSYSHCRLSQFYQVVVPSSGVSESFTVSFRYSGDAKNVMIVEESPKWYRNQHKMDVCAVPLRTTFKDGVASAVFPGICAAEKSEQFFTIGLVEDVTGVASLETKADNSFSYHIKWDIDNNSHKDRIVELVEAVMPELEKIYKNLDMKFSWFSVPYIITADFKEDSEYKKNPNDPSTWGEHRSSKLSTSLSAVYLNVFKFYPLAETKEPNEDLYNQLKQTLVHETFHWIHEAVYDHRTAQDITLGGLIGTRESGEWQMLSEGIATWVEKFTGDKKISENCPAFAPTTISCFFNDEGKANYQGIGYGMGYFIDWLSKKTSNKSIVKLLEYQKTTAQGVLGVSLTPTLRDDFNTFLAEKKLQFFKPWANWETFMWDIVTGKTDERLKPAAMGYSVYIQQDVQKMDYQIKDDIDDIDVYNFSASLQRAVFKNESSMVKKMQSNPGLSLAFYQNNEKLKTWVCDMNFNKLGYAVKDKPFAVPGNKATQRIALLTERLEQDTNPVVIKSELTAQVVPWPKFVEVEWGGIHGDNEYYSWSGDEIKVSYTNNGYYVECDYPMGSHIHFYIGWVNNRFSDVASVYFWQEYNDNNRVQVGKLKLDYSAPSSVEKDLAWKGKYKGDVFYLHCRLQ